MRHEPDGALDGGGVGEGGVEPDAGAHEPEAVGPEHAHLVAPGDLDDLALEIAAAWAGFGETGAEHDDGLDSGAAIVVLRFRFLQAGPRGMYLSARSSRSLALDARENRAPTSGSTPPSPPPSRIKFCQRLAGPKQHSFPPSSLSKATSASVTCSALTTDPLHPVHHPLHREHPQRAPSSHCTPPPRSNPSWCSRPGRQPEIVHRA